jgi:hypothetical protein
MEEQLILENALQRFSIIGILLLILYLIEIEE